MHGLPAAVSEMLATYGLPAAGNSPVLFFSDGSRGEDWALDAASDLSEAVAAAPVPPGRVAVVYLGSPESLASIAPLLLGTPAGGEVAGWFAAGWMLESPEFAAGMRGGEGGDAAAEFARAARLSSIAFDVEPNDANRRIDALLKARGIDPVARADAVSAYASHDAAALFGASLAHARGGGHAGPTSGGIERAAAEPRIGALGDVALDGAGDLRAPSTFSVWRAAAAGSALPPGQGAAHAPELVDNGGSCSVMLERQSLNFRSALNAPSTADRQVVVNSGATPFTSVELRASPWRIGDGGAIPDGAPTLPATLTEIRPVDSGEFEPLEEGTAVAQGLGYDGRYPLLMRINLTGHTSLPGDTLLQYVTYVASC